MTTVNLQFIDALLGPLVGSADDDAQRDRYRNVNADNEYHVKAVIAETIKPRLDNRPWRYRTAARNALAYALLQPDFDFATVYANNRIAFPPPLTARLFFVWLWEILFLEEPLRLDPEYRQAPITRDFNEPLQWGRHR